MGLTFKLNLARLEASWRSTIIAVRSGLSILAAGISINFATHQIHARYFSRFSIPNRNRFQSPDRIPDVGDVSWKVRTGFSGIPSKPSPELWSGPDQSPGRIRSNRLDSGRDSPVFRTGFGRHINMQTSPNAQQKLRADRGNPIRSGPPKLRTPACSTAQNLLNCRQNLQKTMSGGVFSSSRQKIVCNFFLQTIHIKQLNWETSCQAPAGGQTPACLLLCV